ncbi:hypothetical protein [Enterococcus lactis]
MNLPFSFDFSLAKARRFFRAVVAVGAKKKHAFSSFNKQKNTLKT